MLLILVLPDTGDPKVHAQLILRCSWIWAWPSRLFGEETATHSSILAWRISMDRGAWQATVHGVTKSQTWLSAWEYACERTHTRGNLAYLTVELGHSFSPAFELKFTSLVVLDLRYFLSDKTYTTSSPGYPACQLQNLGHLSIHNHVSQLLIISIIYIHVCAKSLQSCLTLCNPMDCSPPGFSVHRIFQARILEKVVISSSRGSSWPGDRTHISCIAGGFFTVEPSGKPYTYIYPLFFRFSSHLGCHRAWSKVPCAIQYVLIP